VTWVTALIGQNTSTCLIRGLSDYMRGLSDYDFYTGQQRCFCVPVQDAFAFTASRLAFHEATERFDWLIGSPQGDEPIDPLLR
jgi:hypothetical protein